MKKNFFIFDGKPSSDFGAYVALSNAWDGAEHDDETVEIPGRNGTLIFNNGRWHNVEMNVECYIPHAMQTNVPGLRAYLSSRYGYCRYEEAIRPEEFRLARFKGPFTLGDADRVGASFTLTFDAKPQRFLKSGEMTRTVTGSTTVVNPTEYTAKPLIRVYGGSSGGTLTVGGIKVTLGSIPTYLDIDCELMEVYQGSRSFNGRITLDNGEFPEFVPGESIVSISGLTSAVITPRWWTI